MSDHIITIEKIVLSSIFFSPDKFEEIAAELNTKDFILPLHQDIFEMCHLLISQNLPIESELLLSRMPKTKKITQEDMLEILAINPIANIEVYVSEIKEASMKRELHTLANLLREKSLEGTQSVEEIVEEVSKRVNDIAMGKTQENVYSAQEMVSGTIEHLKELKKRVNQVVVGVETGFKKLNRLTTGFNKGDLIIIGARPSMGKTTLILNMAQQILNGGKGVAIFSLEMPYVQLCLRMLSAKASIALQNLRVGNLTDPEWEIFTKASNELFNQPIWTIDGSMLTIAQLKGRLRRLKKQHPEIEVAIIDYLQLMGGSKSDAGKQAEVSEISRGLKVLARELEMPIIALSQLNRLVETRDDKRPILSDLRDSGAIEQDADVILFLYRDDVYARRADKERLARLKKEGKEKEFKAEYVEKEIEPAEIIVAKNRNGEVGTVHIQFNKKFTRFEDKPDEVEYDMSETRISGDEFMRQFENSASNLEMPSIS